MEDLPADLVLPARLVLVAMFILLALVAVRRAPRSGSPGWWMAATFGSLAFAVMESWVPDALELESPTWLDFLSTLLLLAFPYLLLRFTASFRALPHWLEIAAATAFAAVVVASAVRYAILAGGQVGPSWDGIYIVAGLTYWVLVSLVSVVRLWQAGGGEPTVARRRMRLMSVATAVLAVVLVSEVQLENVSAVLQLGVLIAAVFAAVAFGLGFSPPRIVRMAWRQPEYQHLQRGTMAVLRATTAEDVARELLPPTVRVVGGGGAAIVDPSGHVAASYGDAAPEVGAPLEDVDRIPSRSSTRQVYAVGDDGGQLIVWTSRYTRFFGREETELLESMAAIASLALERCELLDDERAQRMEVEQAQREAEAARDEANRANTAKSEFLSRMSHELRTPLNAILGFGQLLETSKLNSDDKDAVKYILKAGRHLLALINDVLDLSRIEAGMLTISPEPVHATELINDTVALIQPLADSRSIRVTVDAIGCDVYAKTDRQRCRQILLNLLSNAVKYNYDGGEVGVHCESVTTDTVRISVRDTGPGIDPVRRERLFEPFERLGAEASGVEGTGLGLALSKQLAERLGGAMGVETAPARGATFWIDLPITDRPADAERPETGVDVPRPTTDRTLLLAEDNVANIRVVEAMLRRRPDVSVVPAMQGTMALELAYQHRPDVIILDLHLPDLSGREVLHRLKADARTRDIPVIIASADATPGRVRQLREDGAFEYLTKPLDLGRFLDVIDEAMSRHDESRDGRPRRMSSVDDAAPDHG